MYAPVWKKDLHRINEWIYNNSMVANPAKFQLMFLGNKTSENYSFSLSGQIISESNEVELLGIVIDFCWRTGTNCHSQYHDGMIT